MTRIFFAGHNFHCRCYRDNEVNPTHPLTGKLNYIKEQGASIVTIKVGPIEKESLNSLVSESLCLPSSLCRPLSTVVHHKTSGIILFVLKFLKSLNDEGLLWFSMTSRRWEFDLNKIRPKEISDDVVQHMTQQMTRLSQRMQMALKVAACLGPNFDKKVLKMSSSSDDLDIKSILESCVEGGFLQAMTSNQYVWAHDQVVSQHFPHEIEFCDECHIYLMCFVEPISATSCVRTYPYIKTRVISPSSWITAPCESIAIRNKEHDICHSR